MDPDLFKSKELTASAYVRTCIYISLGCVTITLLYFVSSYIFSIPVGRVVMMLITTLCVLAAVRPAMYHLERWLRFPAALSLLLIYLIIVALLTVASALVVPLVADQASAITDAVTTHWVSQEQLTNMLPGWMAKHLSPTVLNQLSDFARSKIGEVATYLTWFAGSMAGFVGSLLSAGTGAFMILIWGFQLRNPGAISLYVTKLKLADREQSEKITKAIDQTIVELGRWSNAQIGIGAIAGFTFSGLMALAGFTQYAFAIGLVTFLLESIEPMFGNLVTLIFLALPVGLTQGGAWGFVEVIGIYAVVFVLEWELAYPWIMGRALKFDAFITYFCMFLMYWPLGILGSVLVLPCMVIGANVLKYVRPQMFEESDEKTPAHTHLLETMLIQMGIDPNTSLRRRLVQATLPWIKTLWRNLSDNKPSA